MVVCFSYLVKSDLSSEYVYRSVHWTSHFYKGAEKQSCLTGHPVFDLLVVYLDQIIVDPSLPVSQAVAGYMQRTLSSL